MLAWLLIPQAILALDVVPGNQNSVNDATSEIVRGLMSYYVGDQHGNTVGVFEPPYYWWESGAAWGSVLDYWYYTGDEHYNEVLAQALLAQRGENFDYVPSNQSTTEGNDDQAFWGIAVMAAAERNFPCPDDDHQWLYMAQAVFNTMGARWDSDNCGGGLRWQIFEWNSGYDYKNSVSNAGFFHLGARLARFEDNSTYVGWCDQVWDWMENVGLLVAEGDLIIVYDGADAQDNCSVITETQWSYNTGLLLGGCAYLYDYTNDGKWLQRANALTQSVIAFFQDGNILMEAACESVGSCNTDQRSFKAYLARVLGLTAQLIPSLRELIDPLLDDSAIAAAKSCSGGSDGSTCGLNWRQDSWDGWYGLGEQMAALEVIQNTLYAQKLLPYTSSNGGTSKGDPAAGMGEHTPQLATTLIISAGEKVGAPMKTLWVAFTYIAVVVFVLF